MPEFYPAYTLYYSAYLTSEMMWWRDECPIHHPYMLMSYGAVLSLKVPYKWREELSVGREVRMIIDSGGFQLGLGKDIDREAVLKWELDNAVDGDILVPLDFPFQKTVTDDAEVERRARFTAESVERWIKAVDKSGLKVTVTVPMHGFLKKHIQLWYNYVKDFIPVTQSISLGSLAYGFKVTASSVEVILNRIIPAIDFAKHIHIFGIASKAATAYMFLLEDMLRKVRITFDSSSYSKVLAVYKVFVPFTVYKHMVLGRYLTTRSGNDISLEEDKLVQVTCHCPACMKFFGGNMGQWTSRKLRGYINTVLALHNLFHYILYIDKLKTLHLAGRLEKYFTRNFKDGAKVINLTKAFLEGRKPDDSSLMRWLY
jgi:queuine/archaeosine tRNA-ribosyltransferase